MAQRFVTDEGVLVIPGAYPSIRVQKVNSGIATSGVIFLVGEADAGPAWSQETDLSENFFGPTESSAVISKYKTGNIVDAFRSVASPANDPDIVGSPNAIFVVKTNVGSKASANLVRSGLSNYGILADKTYGKLGNLIYTSVLEKTSEVGPTTGAFTYIPGPSLGGSDQATLAVRVNGGVKQTAASPARTIPTAFVATLNGLSGILATGGLDRNTLSGYISTDTLAVAVSGNNIVITGSKVWGTSPTAGDTLIIPLAGTFGATDLSVIAGAANANAGSYVVTASTSTTVSATKLRDTSTTGITAPVAVSAVVVGTEQKDFLAYSPINVQNVTGTDRGLLNAGLVTKTVSGVAVNKVLTLTLQTGSVWNALPQANDFVYIPSTAPAGIKGGSSQNVGWYRVTAATTGVAAGASTITMTSLNNASPVTFGATALAATTDIQCFRPAIDGIGKALELYDNGDSLNIDTQFYTTSGTPVTFLSTASVPFILTSATELSVTLNVSRQTDGVAEVITSGGSLVLLVGYKGTTATLTVGPTTLTTSVVGGSGANLSLTLADFKKVSDLAAFINSQTGYTCMVSTALMGQFATSVLDEGTYSIASDLGAKPGRIKKDGYDFFTQLSRNSSTVQLGTTPLAAISGLPDAQSTTYLSGGAKGGTTAAGLQAAIDTLAKLRGNFVVPLFSRDATLDIADGLTESASTYTIDAVHAAVSAHVTAMSKLKTRRHRQGFLSYKGSFTDAKVKAQTVANYRTSMAFQDVKTIAGDGTIQQFQPWMAAVLAAGIQAAGFYRSILAKGIQCSGVLVPDGTFTDQSNDDLEAAIENGLLAAYRPDTGGVRWSSDQTTYAVDDNSFVFNSIQAVYAADLVALTVAQRMERAFVGQSVADISASVAMSYLKGIMSDIKRLKLIAASDDAALGYKNPQITISGNAMKVELEIKLAGAIMFIPISFLVTQVTQSAQ